MFLGCSLSEQDVNQLIVLCRVGSGWIRSCELKLKLKSLSWFNASQQLSPTQFLTHSITCRVQERTGRVKVRKLLG